jgi:signal transduction histidine kinase
LGLYIAKKVVERYGGSIEVRNNKPRGAVFVLRLKKV